MKSRQKSGYQLSGFSYQFFALRKMDGNLEMVLGSGWSRATVPTLRGEKKQAERRRQTAEAFFEVRLEQSDIHNPSGAMNVE